MSLRSSVKCFSLRGVSIFEQLCFEELLLRTTNKNCLVLNWNINSNAIVLGFSGKPLELLNTSKVMRDNLQVLRRFTGGGTVIVDSDTVFTSLICNSVDVGCKPYPREIMKWTEDFVYSPVFDLLSPRPNADQSQKFGLLENDYVWGDRKIGGNAQTITKGRWVHHTSFLWKFDSTRMGYLKMPSKRPAYRADRPHQDFLCEISPLLREDCRHPAVFNDAMQTQLNNFFQTRERQEEVGSEAATNNPTDIIIEEFEQDRKSGGYHANPIRPDELRKLYNELCAANPGYLPRTYLVEDLPADDS